MYTDTFSLQICLFFFNPHFNIWHLEKRRHYHVFRPSVNLWESTVVQQSRDKSLLCTLGPLRVSNHWSSQENSAAGLKLKCWYSVLNFHLRAGPDPVFSPVFFPPFGINNTGCVSGCCCFQCKDVQERWSGNSILPEGVRMNVRVTSCVSSVMPWQVVPVSSRTLHAGIIRICFSPWRKCRKIHHGWKKKSKEEVTPLTTHTVYGPRNGQLTKGKHLNIEL